MTETRIVRNKWDISSCCCCLLRESQSLSLIIPNQVHGLGKRCGWDPLIVQRNEEKQRNFSKNFVLMHQMSTTLDRTWDLSFLSSIAEHNANIKYLLAHSWKNGCVRMLFWLFALIVFCSGFYLDVSIKPMNQKRFFCAFRYISKFVYSFMLFFLDTEIHWD